MSCISRAIRARSAAAPSRPSWSRSNSSRAARSCKRGQQRPALTDRDAEHGAGDAERGQPDPVLDDVGRRPPRRGHHRGRLGHDRGGDDRDQRAVEREPVERDEHGRVGDLRGRGEPLRQRDAGDEREAQRAAASPDRQRRAQQRCRTRSCPGAGAGPGSRARRSSSPRSGARPRHRRSSRGQPRARRRGRSAAAATASAPRRGERSSDHRLWRLLGFWREHWRAVRGRGLERHDARGDADRDRAGCRAW